MKFKMLKNNTIRIIILLFIFISLETFSQTKTNIKVDFIDSIYPTANIETLNRGWFEKKTINLNNGVFEFSVDLENMELFKVSVAKNKFIILITHPGDNINVSVDLDNLYDSFKVEGSKHIELAYSTEKELLKYKIYYDYLMHEYKSDEKNKTNPEFVNFYKNKLDSVNNAKNDFMVNFINNNLNSPASLFFIERLNINDNIQLYEKLSNNLSSIYPENELVGNLSFKVKAYQNNMVGNIIKDIRLPGINEDTLTLYPLSGKVTVVDFWASWCGPCRAHSKHKSMLYQKYKDEGLSFYSVSLDKNKTNWENAIISDSLGWFDHVSELKGWGGTTNRAFGVKSIPYNIIIDENGKIIGKNLTYEEIEKILNNY